MKMNIMILDFERSNECIDFYNMFFLSVYTITFLNNAYKTLGMVSGSKLNILGILWKSKVRSFQQFSKASGKITKN